ncbi:MAG TPA: hypothetical protein VE818_11295 [Nitrososphaeraceae archaeon]|nr:hypothetical protein [Nitrososphaeraceae archaeon]
MEICVCDTSTKRSSNQAPIDKISKSGDGRGSGGNLVHRYMVQRCFTLYLAHMAYANIKSRIEQLMKSINVEITMDMTLEFQNLATNQLNEKARAINSENNGYEAWLPKIDNLVRIYRS